MQRPIFRRVAIVTSATRILKEFHRTACMPISQLPTDVARLILAFHPLFYRYKKSYRKSFLIRRFAAGLHMSLHRRVYLRSLRANKLSGEHITQEECAQLLDPILRGATENAGTRFPCRHFEVPPASVQVPQYQQMVVIMGGRMYVIALSGAVRLESNPSAMRYYRREWAAAEAFLHPRHSHWSH